MPDRQQNAVIDRGWIRPLRWLGPFIVAATYVVLMRVTWLRWPDAIIDFGRELYLPWRITEGDMLHRELAVFFGPLSAYVNALWFTLFGTSLMTLAMVNAVILTAFSAFLYWLLKSIAGHWSATVGSVAFLMVFAFGHLQGMANYNFIAPYSHELVHGAMLGFVCVAMLARFMRTRRVVDAAAAGLLLGLAFLTKLEPFVATIAAVAVGWVAWWMIDRKACSASWKGLAAMAAMSLVPPIVCCTLLATAMPFEHAVRGTLGSWMYVGDANLRNLPVYRVLRGTNKFALNLGMILKWTGFALLVPVAAMIVSTFLRPRGPAALIVGAAAAMVTVVCLWWTQTSFEWEQIARSLPLVTFAALTCSIIAARRGQGDPAHFSVAMLRFMFVAFAMAMMLKMFFNVRFAHYGFVLAMPATLVALAALMDWLPNWLEARHRTGWIMRGSSLGAIVIWLIAMQHFNLWNLVPTAPIGQGRDQFLTDKTRAQAIDVILNNLKKIAPPGSTMTVLPEGVMLNYLLRMDNPVPYLTFLPSDIIIFGEQSMLESLRNNPSDYIALVHRDSREFGTRFFGRDFGVEINEWIQQNYVRLGLSGDEPSMDTSLFGILVMQRKPDVAP